jgi:hypothetical protein
LRLTWPGFFPAIFLRRGVRRVTEALRLVRAARPLQPAGRGKNCAPRPFFFIIFVDAIFTTLLERLFTNVFDVIAQTATISCLYLARITD